uniref:Ribonuclease H-like domain-containing protein n=1 Tax=Tanacetum cinerariifolium TaxID=118510 RepID=A0A699GUY8_TANCI|nr:ribonuclease H-like domain-containing protein [Tanacetum cinerariifolium]
MNGDEPVQTTRDKNGVETEVPPKTAQAILARQIERKAKSILLLVIPDEYQLRFHTIKDDKSLWAAIKSRLIMMTWNKWILNGKWTCSYERKRFYKKTGRKLNFNSKEPDNALIVQDGLGYDWSYIAQEEPTEFAHMAYTSRTDTEVKSCSKNCATTYEKLQKQIDEQRQTLNKANLEIVAYQLGLESVDAQLIIHQKNEVAYEETIAVLEFEEKKFEISSKNLNKLINSQLSTKDKTGLGYRDLLSDSDSEVLLSVFDSPSSDGDDNKTNDMFKKDDGYHVVPPPLTGNYMPPLADLSFAGLDDSVYRPTSNKASASISKGSTVEGNGATAVKTSAGNPQQALKYKGMFDSGCSRHMTGNKALLTDYQDIDGGFVAFGGSSKGGKLSSIGKIRTNKIDFEDEFFVKELKFNLLSISQMYDKKNSVLFTKTECLVLSLDFKLIDESQVLLKVPRQNNMYSFDLKNVVPSRNLTCLFAKAIIDESNI